MWWDGEKKRMPELNDIARVALTAPMTQASVERLLSSLRFVLSPQRSGLSPESLEVILLRSNNL